MTRRDSLLALLVVTIWGVNFVVIEWGMKGVPPLVFAAVRFTLVALPAVFFLPRPQVPFWQVAAVGMGTWAGQYCFLYASIGAGMPPGLASLVLQAQVVLTIVFAVVALREPPTRGQVLGVALGAVGLVVVALGRGGHVPAGALLLCLGGAVTWAIGNVVSRAAKVPGGLALAAWAALVAALPAYVIAALVDGPHVYDVAWHAFGWRAVASTAFTVVLSSLTGFGIYNGLLSRYPSSTVVPWVLLVPAVGIAAAWLFLGEQPNLPELIGGAVLIAGVLVAQRPARSSRADYKSSPDSESALLMSSLIWFSKIARGGSNVGSLNLVVNPAPDPDTQRRWNWPAVAESASMSHSSPSTTMSSSRWVTRCSWQPQRPDSV